MKTTLKIVIVVLIALALIQTCTNIASAKDNKPFPYKIDNAHVVEKNHKITIEWQQTQPAQVTVYKLNSHYISAMACVTVETILFRANGLVGTIRVTDKHHRNNDQYYIYQSISSHSYGPFIPTYR